MPHSGPRRRALLAALALGVTAAGPLAGCATPATAPATPAVAMSALEGRLALRIDGQPERDLSASFELSGSAEQGLLLLSGPLGATAARASWSPQGATLHTGEGQQQFDSLDALAERALGEPFPIAVLFDWLRGRPWPGAAASAREDGVAGFVQLGWQVSLARLAEGWLEARRAGPPGMTVRVRLASPS